MSQTVALITLALIGWRLVVCGKWIKNQVLEAEK